MAMTDAPASPSDVISRPITSRRHGHWPTVARLRSSTSTMATRPAGAGISLVRTTMSYAASSTREKSGGRKIARAAVTRTGTTPVRKITRRCGEARRLTRRLPDRDPDAAIAGLGCVVARFDEQIGLAMGSDVDSGGGKAGLYEDVAHALRALEAERDV